MGLGDNTILLGVIGERGEELWKNTVESDGAFPVGLYREGDGRVLIMDDQGVLYFFSPDGVFQEKKNTLLGSFESQLTSPIGQVVVTPGASPDGGDLFFVLAPEQLSHKVFVRPRLPGQRWLFELYGLNFIDEGIGTEKGQTLAPVALAFDRQRARLLVLEAQGRLQVFDAAPTPTGKRRYITQWGRWGTGEGEFFVSPWMSAALAVDSKGMIYVADGTRRIQVFNH